MQRQPSLPGNSEKQEPQSARGEVAGQHLLRFLPGTDPHLVSVTNRMGRGCGQQGMQGPSEGDRAL